MKSIKKALNTLILPLVIICSSCESEESLNSALVNIGVNLDVRNTDGQNIFDPTTDNFIDPAGIRIFYKENGSFKLYFKENYDAQYGFSFQTDAEPSWMRLAPELLSTGEVPEHVIQWNDQDSDTLNFEVDVQNNGGYVFITKVWYNGDLAWDKATDNEIRLISVTK